MRVLVLLLVLPLAGCSGGSEGGPATSNVEETETLRARGFIELNLEMEEGAAVSWSFESSRPLVWDVHTHDGESVEILDNGTDAAASGSFTAARAGVYSLFLQNPSSTAADVTYRARGHFDVRTA